MSAVARLPLGGRIAIAAAALAVLVAAVAVIALVSNGTAEVQAGRNFFAVFAILGGIGFIVDAFKREGAPQGIPYVVLKFTSLAFALGLIVGGGWAEYWWQLTMGGVAAGIVVGTIEKAIGTDTGPNYAFRLVVWGLVGLAATAEGVWVILPL